MVPFIILLACIFAGVALHLYQVLSLLVWIGRRAQCSDRCEMVASAPGPALAIVSLSAEPPDSMRETCHEHVRRLHAARGHDEIADAHRPLTT